MPIMKTIFLTKNLGEDAQDKLAESMKPEKFNTGETIIKYGDQGSTYYILSKGSVKVIVYHKGTDPSDPDLENKVVFTKVLEKGCGFGELALLYNDKRSATIQALEECQTYTLDGITFKSIIIKSSIDRREQMSKFLNSIQLFGKQCFKVISFRSVG